MGKVSVNKQLSNWRVWNLIIGWALLIIGIVDSFQIAIGTASGLFLSNIIEMILRRNKYK